MTLLLLLGALPLVPTSAPASAGEFVTADGSRLMLGGRPWRAIGVNVWDMDPAKVNRGDITGCYYQHADLDAYFDATFRRIAERTRATVVRTFGFRMSYTAGGRDWSATDKLLFHARRHNLRVIPVLGDQHAGCGAPAKSPAWYHCTQAQPATCTPGYRVPDPAWGIDYRSYAIAAAKRYKDDPTIAFWQLMNEARSGTVNGRLDETALVDFSRDMVHAIKVEAGDQNHLVNLGAFGPGTELPYYTWLLECSTSSRTGCNDLAEIHYYNQTGALPGTPFGSAVDATMIFDGDDGSTNTQRIGRPWIDGWATQAVEPGFARPARRFRLVLSAPAPGFTVHVDRIVVTTGLGVHTYSFEAGADGFWSRQASLSSSTTFARDGLSSLRVAIPPGGYFAELESPLLPSQIVSVELSMRVPFDGPAPEAGVGITLSQHAAVVGQRKPYFVGEAGVQAAVPGLGKCATHRSTADRAAIFERQIAAQTDDVHRSSGFIVWDYKDPAILATTPAGASVPDPTVDCWTVVPGDPAEAVLAAAAAVTPNPLLPPPAPLADNPPLLHVLQGIGSEMASESEVPVVVRVTDDGNPVRLARVVVSGACVGAGVTDALGHASFSCRSAGPGSGQVEIAVDRDSCGCIVAPVRAEVTVKRGARVLATGRVGETGSSVPVAFSVEHYDGSSVQGLKWSIPECGRSGTIATAGPRATIEAACAATWTGTAVIRVRIDATETTAAVEVPVVVAAFDRLYIDAGSGNCVGLSPDTGWVGFTQRSRRCTAGDAGAVADWSIGRVAPGARATTFTRAGGSYVVALDRGANGRLAGRFVYDGAARAFSAVLVRPDGVHAIGA